MKTFSRLVSLAAAVLPVGLGVLLTANDAAALNPISRDEIVQIGISGIGYSYWWGHARWQPGGVSNPGKCTGSCGSCSHKAYPSGPENGADCSGFVAKAWKVPDSNADITTQAHPYSTSDFKNDTSQWTTVPKSQAQAGDALVRNAGGHIQLIESVNGDGTFNIIHAKGCKPGIRRDHTTGSGYHVIRRTGVSGEASPPADPTDPDEGGGAGGSDDGGSGSGSSTGSGSSGGASSGSGSSTGSGSGSGSGSSTGSGSGSGSGSSSGSGGSGGSGGATPSEETTNVACGSDADCVGQEKCCDLNGDSTNHCSTGCPKAGPVCDAQAEPSEGCPSHMPNCCPLEDGPAAGGSSGAGGASGGGLACTVNPCGTCDHSTSTEGAALKESCSTCAQKVCDEDAYCCKGAWDFPCTMAAKDLCGG